MIYLIEMKMPYTRVRAFKVGSTSDIERRMKQYRTHNPYIELLDTMDFDTIEASKITENACHEAMRDCEEVFRQFGKHRSNEWFEVIDKTIIKRLEEYGFYALGNIVSGITEEEAEAYTQQLAEW